MERLVLAAALCAVLTPCQGFNVDRKLSTTLEDPARELGQSVEQSTTKLKLQLLVFPWTWRYFINIGSLSSVATILGNPNVREHGKKVLIALGGGKKDMDNIKGTLVHLSKLITEKLHVDPQNVRLLGNCLMMDLTPKKGTALIPSIEVGWENFLQDVCATLSERYR